MTYKVQRWGNSLAIRIPQRLARGAGLHERSPVDLRLEHRCLVIEPLATPPALDHLLAGVPVTLWSKWMPGRGDVVSVETAATGRRSALVLSPAAYSARKGSASICPIDVGVRADPFAVELPRGCPVQGVVLADRVTVVDVRSCGVQLVCRAPDEVVAAVLDRVRPLFGELDE
jgi:mRNA-degrading endonuclease toxin of MazEF toxin-antitoxin module/antitoxin component of MazEF toxin-antitoxin module